jgi:hypothetical protein
VECTPRAAIEVLLRFDRLSLISVGHDASAPPGDDVVLRPSRPPGA